MGPVLNAFLKSDTVRKLEATVRDKVAVLGYALLFLCLAIFTILGLEVAIAVRVFHNPELPLVVLSCPDGWVGYQRKCYYFSQAEGNWDSSQSQCAALDASLAGIDSLQELAFLMSYKRCDYPWIGLRREEVGQPWKWVNGTEFSNRFPVMGGAECAYLNDVGVSSAKCLRAKNWVCSKPSWHLRKD